MRKLLNTLYVTTPDTYLSVSGKSIVISKNDETLLRVPMHNLERIVSFSRPGASPALMGACVEHEISLTFLTPTGKFLAEVVGSEHGNVLLRKEQYRISDDENRSGEIAKNFLIGKLYNSKCVLERMVRDHSIRVNVSRIQDAILYLSEAVIQLRASETLASLRGIEGKAAEVYFSVFDELILQSKDVFFFRGRTRRPPLDNINALLSFSYTLLANEAASAARVVGLDPYVGFLHRDRPGRKSFALDLIEELRAVQADRFVLSIVNTKQIENSDFYKQENGAVLLKDDARRKFLGAWQQRKQEEIRHPFLGEKIEWGLVPYVQALLFARYLRGDLDEYPPFLWR